MCVQRGDCGRGGGVGWGLGLWKEAGGMAQKALVSHVSSLEFLPHLKSQQTFIHV